MKKDLKENFLKKGIQNAYKSKSLDLIEKVWPNLYWKTNLKPSKFIVNIFSEIEKKFQPTNSTRGKIFEYLMMCVFFRNNIEPFFYQVNLSLVPNVNFDFVLFDLAKNPIVISIKTSSRERYKQVELESLVAKQVHRKARCVYITYEDEGVRFIEKKKENNEILYIDEAYTIKDSSFDAFIKNLSKSEFGDPGIMKFVNHGILLE